RLPGIIMLVPGSASLRGLLTLIQQQDVGVGQSAMLTVLNIIMALVAGLLFGNLLIPARKNLEGGLRLRLRRLRMGAAVPRGHGPPLGTTSCLYSGPWHNHVPLGPCPRGTTSFGAFGSRCRLGGLSAFCVDPPRIVAGCRRSAAAVCRGGRPPPARRTPPGAAPT